MRNGYIVFLMCFGVCSCGSRLKFQDYGAAFNICINLPNQGYTPANTTNYKEQESEYDGQTIFSWKNFYFNIFSNVSSVSQKCKIEHQIHLNGLMEHKLNSLKLFDASAKPAAGILSGNINQYGDYDECLEVPNAQYCLVFMDVLPLWKTPMSRYKHLAHSHFSITETFDDPGHRVPGFTFSRWGFCIPKGCTDDDLVNALKEKFDIKAKIRPGMCQATDTPIQRPTWADYLAKAYFVMIIVVTGISSFLYRSSDQQSQKGSLRDLLTSFAIQRNYQQLKTLSEGRKDYKSLHGVRFFSALALLMAHKTMALLYNPYINKTRMSEIQAMKWSVIGRNAIIYTDCFLLMSGLLNANALFIELEKHKKLNFKEKIVNRLVRIFPGLFTIILFCTYILPYLGSGPLWPLVINHHSELCKKYMWRNFLFVHNYFGFDKMCLTHTHQIGMDMQLFFATPLFVYALWKGKVMGLWIIGCAVLLSTFLRFYNTIYYNLSHIVHYGIPISRMFDTADYSYILPTHRATIYLMGVVLAWLLRNRNKIFHSKKSLFYAWTVAYVLGLATWFGPMSMSIKGYKYDNLEAAIYGAIYPFTWGAAISWAIYATEIGFDSWFAPILTWKYFQIFTKIAYGVYLIQFPVFFYNVGITRHAEEFKHYMMLPPLETLFILLLATVFAIIVEIPFQNLHKSLVAKYKGKNDAMKARIS